MGESGVDGIVIVEAEDQVILTDIEQLEVSSSSYVVSKIVKRGKTYFKRVNKN